MLEYLFEDYEEEYEIPRRYTDDGELIDEKKLAIEELGDICWNLRYHYGKLTVGNLKAYYGETTHLKRLCKFSLISKDIYILEGVENVATVITGDLEKDLTDLVRSVVDCMDCIYIDIQEFIHLYIKNPKKLSLLDELETKEASEEYDHYMESQADPYETYRQLETEYLEDKSDY